MTLASDNRGLALGIVTFFAMLIIAALLFILMNSAATEFFSIMSADATSQGASDQISMAETIWANILYVALFIGTLFLIARAVNEGART